MSVVENSENKRSASVKAAAIAAMATLWMASATSSGAPILTLFGTGVAANDASGQPMAVLADGVTDTHYQLISAPGGVNVGAPFVTIQNGYPFQGVDQGVWSPDGGRSKWISPQANENSYNGGAPNDPAGTYVYQTTFDLSGLDPSTARISGYITADNSLFSLTLNGVDTGMPGAGLGGNSYFTINHGFGAGKNVLQFFVNNDPPRHADPSGLRVEMAGSASPLPNRLPLAITHVGGGRGSYLPAFAAVPPDINGFTVSGLIAGDLEDTVRIVLAYTGNALTADDFANEDGFVSYATYAELSAAEPWLGLDLGGAGFPNFPVGTEFLVLTKGATDGIASVDFAGQQVPAGVTLLRAAAIPEPSCLGIALLAVTRGLGRRARRSRSMARRRNPKSEWSTDASR